MENKSYNFEYEDDDVLEYHKRVVLTFDIDSIDSSAKDEHYISYRNLLSLIEESLNEGVKDCCYCTRKVDVKYIKDFRKVVL